jgi:hypothetical protein
LIHGARRQVELAEVEPAAAAARRADEMLALERAAVDEEPDAALFGCG